MVDNNKILSIYDYTVISLPSSVIYFGGTSSDGLSDEVSLDKVAEYKNLEWNLLGYLASARRGHSSIIMNSKIYSLGGAESMK